MSDIHHILKSRFGYDQFRPAQEQIISDLVSGENLMVIMPTGGGKSLCYQVPALARAGCAIVVSPLIALMQDQVNALSQLGIRAAFINSTLDSRQVYAIEQEMLKGELDIVYMAPERLVLPDTLKLLKRVQLSLFAIDEAHCVSQWGHDFRADYLGLSVLAEQFADVPRIALTATADKRTRTEIIERLGLQSGRHYVTGFDRPNIRYQIELKRNAKTQLLKFIKTNHANDAGVVYCMSRAKVEDTAIWLQGEGFNALPYHAGLDVTTRANHQARFLREDSVIIVATIAFGMGIDKPDVRFVAHLDMPKTIEAYYQETGRAGRDGEPANTFMVYGLQDVIKLRQMMLDSEGNEEHKRAEQQRLNAMLGLCEITSCRRQALLNYFGEYLPKPCGNCDTCISPPPTWDATTAAQKALSATYRSGQRFGVSHVIDILRGSDTQKIRQFGHQELSTFGVGKDLDVDQWRSVFRQLVARGYLDVDLARFGALVLNERCRPILKGEQSIDMRRDVKTKNTTSRRTRTPLPDDIDVGLWEALRTCRRELADDQNVPPYVIFNDKTLQEMARVAPRSYAEMSAISGVGDRKLEKYGATFMRVINQTLG